MPGLDFDVLVIGSGFGGSVAAMRAVAKDMKRPYVRAPLGIFFGTPGSRSTIRISAGPARGARAASAAATA